MNKKTSGNYLEIKAAKEEKKLKKKLGDLLHHAVYNSLDINSTTEDSKLRDIYHKYSNTNFRKVSNICDCDISAGNDDVLDSKSQTSSHSLDQDEEFRNATSEKENHIKDEERNDASQSSSETIKGNLTHTACSNLGEELLALYYTSDEVDMTICVQDTKFKCHKSILVARSEYFSAMLCGGWQESDNSIVAVQGILPETFELVLRAIYGAVIINEISESELCHLVVAADMYHLTDLKLMITFIIKKYYCHFFHKPCDICSIKAAKCLPMLYSYGMSDLFNTFLTWINENTTRMWKAKSFATLPTEIIALCGKKLQTVGVKNCLQCAIDVNDLLERLSSFQTKTYDNVCETLHNVRTECISFIAQDFSNIAQLSLYTVLKGRSWGWDMVENILTEAIESHPVDSLCQSLLWLNSTKQHFIKLIELERKSSNMDLSAGFSQEYLNFITHLMAKVENRTCINLNLVIDTDGWKELDPRIRKQIEQSASFVFVNDSKIKRKKPQLSSQKKTPPLNKCEVTVATKFDVRSHGARPKTSKVKHGANAVTSRDQKSAEVKRTVGLDLNKTKEQDGNCMKNLNFIDCDTPETKVSDTNCNEQTADGMNDLLSRIELPQGLLFQCEIFNPDIIVNFLVPKM